MPIVEYFLEDGKGLIPEEEEARIRIQEAVSRRLAQHGYPSLTEKQLSEFKPVNFSTMEERAEAMETAGLIDSEGKLLTREPVLIKKTIPKNKPNTKLTDSGILVYVRIRVEIYCFIWISEVVGNAAGIAGFLAVVEIIRVWVLGG